MSPDPIDLYTVSGWPGSAWAHELLRQTGRPVRFRDLLAQPLSWDELKHLAAIAGGVRHLLSIQAPGYRGRGLHQPSVSEIELLGEMVEDPSLIRQPIVVVDGVVLVGFGGPWPDIVPTGQR